MSYAQVFRCAPTEFLDRDESEYPVLIACLREADQRLRRQAEEARNGKR